MPTWPLLSNCEQPRDDRDLSSDRRTSFNLDHLLEALFPHMNLAILWLEPQRMGPKVIGQPITLGPGKLGKGGIKEKREQISPLGHGHK